MANIVRLSLGHRSAVHRRLIKTATRLTLLLLILLVVMIVILLPKMTINQVKVVGGSNCANLEMIREKSQLQGKSWIFFEANPWERQLLEQFICLEEVKATRLLPDIVELKVKDRAPVVVIKLVSRSLFPDLLELESTPSSQAAQIDFLSRPPFKAFLVDRLGFVFSQDLSQAGELPHIFVTDESLTLGQRFEGDVISKSSAILKKISGLIVNPRQVKLIGQTLVVSGESQLIFSLEKDYRRQLASLQLILQKAKMEADPKPIERIDLRFDKPVVVYAPKKKVD